VKPRMKRWIIAFLGVLVLGILGLLFWELEYQHLSLILWLLVIVALLWGCARVAVSLQAYPRALRKRTSASNSKKPRISQWVISLAGALLLGVIGVIFWRLGFETTSQLLWFLVCVALLWCCAQVSFLLRPSGPQEGPQLQWSEALFPGSSLRSGFYNKDNAEVWDGNENLPPSGY